MTDATKYVATLLDQVTTNQTSQVFSVPNGDKTIQAFVTGTGAVSAVVTWYGSNYNQASNGVLLATSTLSGTTSDATGAVVTEDWPFIYAVVSAISGTSAKVTASMGY